MHAKMIKTAPVADVPINPPGEAPSLFAARRICSWPLVDMPPSRGGCMLGWLKKQSAAGTYEDRPSYQMRSDQRFTAAIEFFTEVLQIVIERKEGFVRDGLQAEFEALRHSGLAFILASSQLALARSAAHIPRLLKKIDAAAISFVADCDRLAFFAKNQDVTYMMDGLKRATDHVFATAEAEYRPRSTQAYGRDVSGPGQMARRREQDHLCDP